MPGVIVENYTFSPTAIPGCILWMDATDPNATGVQPANGASLTTWKDKSASGFTLTSVGSAYSRTAVNARAGINIGTNYMGYDPGSSVNNWQEVFAVGLWTGGTTFNTYNALITSSIDSAGDSANGIGFIGEPGVTTLYTTTTWLPGPVINGTTTTTALPTMSSPFVIRGNAASAVNLQGIRLGYDRTNSGRQWIGFISEVICYNTALTLNQRQQVEGYLAWKWALQASLIGSQPYKVNAPLATNLPTGLPYQLQFKLSQTGFNPRQITGCQLWIDAANPTGFIKSGSTVTQLIDKSGNGYNSTSATGTVSYEATSFNGLPTFSFNGTGGFRGPTSITGTTLTAFCVGNASVSSGFNTRFFALGTPTLTSYQNPTTCEPFLRSASGTENIVSYRFNTYQSFTPYVLGTNFIATATYTGASNIMYLFGVGQTPVASSGSFAISQYGFGCEAKNGNSAMNGFISEVILYDSALTEDQQQQVENYLGWKWGLTSSLSPTRVPLFPFPFSPTPYSGRLVPF